MTDKTATQNLTRTVASDDPRKMATYLQSLAQDVDLRMASHFRDLARSKNPPFAVLQLNTPAIVDRTSAAGPGTGSVPFDTAPVDNADLTDMSASAYQIVLTQTGFWLVGAYLLCDGFGAGADLSMTLHAGDAEHDTRHDNITTNQGLHVLLPVRVNSLLSITPTYVTLDATSTARNTSTVSYAEMFACKVRDL
jgi:hypothetical protein